MFKVLAHSNIVCGNLVFLFHIPALIIDSAVIYFSTVLDNKIENIA